MQAKTIQLVRNREYDMVMFHRKGTLHQVVDPKCLFCSLAFGTVSVATTVVAVADGSTGVTYFFMTTQGSLTATDDLREYLLLQGC